MMTVGELFSRAQETVADIVARELKSARAAYGDDKADVEVLALRASGFRALLSERSEVLKLNARQASKMGVMSLEIERLTAENNRLREGAA